MAAHKISFIVDASVLLKWGVHESDSRDEAELLREDFQKEKIAIFVPPHCFSEICNMLGRERRDGAASFVSILLNTEIVECLLTFSLIQTAFRIMEQYDRVSFYDASYHALAIQEKGTFITADEKYYRKTHREGYIQLLKNYGKKR